jgi:hypothetical protein
MFNLETGRDGRLTFVGLFLAFQRRYVVKQLLI